MNAVLLLDNDAQTGLSEDLKERLLALLEEKYHQVEIVALDRKNVMPCLGCFHCLTKHVGVCVAKDRIADIRDHASRYDLTVFLTPVVFGHFSATIKSAIDRGCGAGNHEITIGYGDDLDEDEQSTFLDLTRKHRGKADIVHPGFDSRVEVYLTTSRNDNASICEAVKQAI
ncbi:MAG TPA: flavodoxin family protein [Anaerolineaceae bacterium]